MGRRRVRGRNVNGILLLDKPLGITSNNALQQVKNLFFASKAGHTGSLDPLAGGLLPICLGSATKISAFLLDADKHYWARVRLGITTTTQDSEGEIVEQRPTDHITPEQIASALDSFRGEIQQIPPMYSAIKHKGERLYRLAREGQEVEREARTLQIHQLTLGQVALPDFEITVHCSKGTYVRTLAEDIGNVLGCGAHITALRRTGVGPYREEAGMITLPELESRLREQGPGSLDPLLLPLESALGHWPEVRLSADTAFYLRQGQPVIVPNAPTSGQVRLHDANGFFGVGEVLEDGRIAPRRLL